jgi:predicted aldo/keto reductase-like oxidoreductase
MEAMEQLKKSGKVRWVGITTHSNMAACLNEAARKGFHDVILTAFNYAHASDKGLIQALQNAASKGIGLVAMKTQCSQYWYKEELPADLQRYYEGSLVQSAVLKWVLNHEFIATAAPGFTTFAQLEEDVAAGLSPALKPEEKKFLEDRGVKMAMASYCRQCATCVNSCPQGVDIPSLMRVHMYAVCYGNLGQARETYDAIPREKGLSACASCDACISRCVNRIEIPRRLENLKALFV